MDEQCQGEVAHLAKALSTRDYLLKEPSFVQKEFGTFQAVSGAAVLAEKSKLLFQPAQKRHNDTHYCSALFCYLSEMSIKFNNHCQLECMDDKHI